MTPYLAEDIWRNLAAESRPASLPESVHLADWPVADAALVDETLNQRNAARPARRIARTLRPQRSRDQGPPTAPRRQRRRPLGSGRRSRRTPPCHDRRRTQCQDRHPRGRRSRLATLHDQAEPARARSEAWARCYRSLRSALEQPVARIDLAHRPGRRGGPVRSRSKASNSRPATC